MYKIAIIPDTNILFSSNGKTDFNNYDLNSTLKNVFKMIEDLSFEKDVKIVLPEIVWLEIIQQRKEQYLKCTEEINAFNKKYILPNVEIKITEFNLDEHIENLLNTVLRTYISQNKLYFDMPINIDYESIVKRAISKSPPFEGKEKNSDKGFKDAILWDSILNYKELNGHEALVLYTNDSIFEQILKNEYYEKFNDNIEVIKNEIDLRNYLSMRNDKPNLEFEMKTEIYRRIRAEVLTTDIVKQNYRDWMENRSAYGTGIKVAFIDNIEVENISTKDEADFPTNTEYYIKVKIMSRLQMYDDLALMEFNPVLHIGVEIIEDQVLLELEGIEGALVTREYGTELLNDNRIPFSVVVDAQSKSEALKIKKQLDEILSKK